MEATEQRVQHLLEDRKARPAGAEQTDLAIASTLREAEQLRRRLRLVSPGDESKAAGFRQWVAQIRDTLGRERSALLVYRLQPGRSFVWIIDGEGTRMVALRGEEEIGVAVQRFHSYLRTLDPRPGEPPWVATAHELYRLLIEPVKPHLQGRKTLIVIPHGVLTYLPFEALVDPGEPVPEPDRRPSAFLVQNHDIVYASSVSTLAAMALHTMRQGYHWELVAFGDPIMPGEQGLLAGSSGVRVPETGAGKETSDLDERLKASQQEAWAHFPRLPHTGAEVLAAAGFVREDQRRIYLRTEASEAHFKKTLRSGPARVVHIATHGILNERRPALSGLLFSVPSANAGGADDGILYLHEILNLSIDSELVVLSACDTGRGRLVRGEGVQGLSRAFMYAGARSVIMSLWQVSDEATAVLMKAFYGEYLGKQKSKTESLSQAKRVLLGNPRYAAPYFWASFVLNGP